MPNKNPMGNFIKQKILYAIDLYDYMPSYVDSVHQKQPPPRVASSSGVLRVTVSIMCLPDSRARQFSPAAPMALGKVFYNKPLRRSVIEHRDMRQFATSNT